MAISSSGRQAYDLFGPRQSKWHPRPWRAQVSGLLAVGGIDYGADPGKSAAPVVCKQCRPAHRSMITGGEPGSIRSPRQPGKRSFAASSISVPSLEEAARLLTGSDASEANIARELSAGYRYVHLATHGFFESPEHIAALRAGFGSDRVDPLPRCWPPGELSVARSVSLAPLWSGSGRGREASRSAP